MEGGGANPTAPQARGNVDTGLNWSPGCQDSPTHTHTQVYSMCLFGLWKKTRASEEKLAFSCRELHIGWHKPGLRDFKGEKKLQLQVAALMSFTIVEKLYIYFTHERVHSTMDFNRAPGLIKVAILVMI